MHEIIRQGDAFEVTNNGKTEVKGNVNQYVVYQIEGSTYATKFRDFDDDAELLVALACRVDLG